MNPAYLSFLFGLSKDAPLPDYPAMTKLVSPAPYSSAASMMQGYVSGFADTFNFVDTPSDDNRAKGKISAFRPTFLGWWIAAGAAVSLLSSRYRNTLGIWTLAAGGYLLGTFLLGVPSPRYFSPAWPVMVLLLALPVECILQLIRRTIFTPKSEPPAAGVA